MRDADWRRKLSMRATALVHLLALVAVLAAPGEWPWALGAVLANHAVLALFSVWPRSQWLGENWTQLPTHAAMRREVALTFDDGPDPVVTRQVLDLLDRHSAHATFFCVADRAERHPDVCREIVRRGHAVENHSQHHQHHFALHGLSRLKRELQAAQDTLAGITGQRPAFFRAPAGMRNPFLDPVLRLLGLRLVSWTVRGFDARIGDAGRVASRLLGSMRAGAILLLHDGNAARTREGIPVVLEVLPRILAAGAAGGLRFVTLREAMP